VDLISSLRTAVSAQNTEWLEMNAALVAERHVRGELSDPAYETFQTIIEAARNGEWETAERHAIAYQKAQRPTRAEIERTDSRGHKHGS
jgi:hypothetical protein